MNRLWKIVFILLVTLVVAMGLSSCCTKETTWRDYGDFYSFDEGLYFDGLEYHERHYAFRNGMMLPWFAMKIWSSVIKMQYSSYDLASSPWRGGNSVYLHFTLVADSLLYEPGKRWEMKGVSDGRNCGEVVFSGEYNGEDFDTGYHGWDIKGWLSFTIGDHMGANYDNMGANYYWIKDCRFEFEITGPNGEILSITEGYKRHVGSENVGL